LLVIVAYVTGQVIANVSGFLIESKLVAGVLERPTKPLFGAGEKKLAPLFPGYYRPLPSETQQRVLKNAQVRAGISTPSGGLFFTAMRWSSSNRWCSSGSMYFSISTAFVAMCAWLS
jgi:hypothetical protein